MKIPKKDEKKTMQIQYKRCITFTKQIDLMEEVPNGIYAAIASSKLFLCYFLAVLGFELARALLGKCPST
jgi:hypothetical protein